jgi:hypothetical protein
MMMMMMTTTTTTTTQPCVWVREVSAARFGGSRDAANETSTTTTWTVALHSRQMIETK